MTFRIKVFSSNNGYIVRTESNTGVSCKEFVAKDAEEMAIIVERLAIENEKKKPVFRQVEWASV